MRDPHAALSPRSSLEKSPDEQLVEVIRAGLHEAVVVLFDRHHEAMLSFCRHMLGRRDEAEDVVRASFEQALRGVRRHDRPVRIKALLFTIARNQCEAVLEARPARDTRTDVAGLDPEIALDAELQLLTGQIARLPLDQRAVILLHELDAHTREEIAAIAGCPADKADALLAQARTALTGAETPEDWACAHVRPVLASSGGAEPTREAMRRHVATCESCTEFRAALVHQRRYLAIVLPVTPSDDLLPPAPVAPPAPPTVAPPDGPERRGGLARMRRAVRR
jgi:RNA polymerase sigma factor (sigma-70 family)